MPILLFVALVIVKTFYMQALLSAESHFDYSWLSVFVSDAWLLALTFALLAFSLLTESKLFRIFLRLILLSVIVLFSVDALVIMLLSQRATFVDLQQFVGYGFVFATEMVGNDLLGFLVFLLVTAGVLLFSLRFAQIPLSACDVLTKPLILLSVLLATVAAFAKADISYMPSWPMQNVLEYNYRISYHTLKPYDKKTLVDVDMNKVCQPSEVLLDGRPVVILMVESLSNYQSKLFSGLNNWTPNLDRIAQQHQWYSQFYANGYTTEDAEVAMLTGKLPLHNPETVLFSEHKGFFGFWSKQSQSLPYLFRNAGYQSEFVTSSDLSFTDTGAWMRHIGFERILGSEQQAFVGKTRLHFNSVGDQYLLSEVAHQLKQKLSAQKRSQFIFIKTVSGHAPYYHPETGSRQEAEVVSYVDQQIGAFYQALQEMGFFEDGILLIVGDHHAMVPVTGAEQRLYGKYRASAMVPLIVAAPSLFHSSQLIERPVQQVDIYHGLASMLTAQQCHSLWYGDLWHRSSPIQFHKRGDLRGYVSAFTHTNSRPQQSLILLSGNQTHIEGSSVRRDSELKPLLVPMIDQLRYANH